MEIHSLYILKESGVCFYSRNFSDEDHKIKVDLITPFFSAILSFSENVVSKRLEVLEMSGLRFVFRKERGFVFVVLADDDANLLFIRSRLDKITQAFFRTFGNQFELEGNDCEVIENPKFDEIVDSYIHAEDDENQVKSTGLYSKVIDYFKKLKNEHEILGAALLTTKGTIIFSSLTEDLLFRVMKELEIRYMTGTFDVPQLFYTLGNGQKVCERIISYRNFISLLLVVQFEPNYQLGMVDYETETIAEKLISFF